MKYSPFFKAIARQKAEVQISFGLKNHTQQFTELLYRSLFDDDTDAASAMGELEDLFKIIRDLVCPERQGQPCTNWEQFCESIPALFERLKKDANALLANDPAARSLEEVYLAYPGFYAIAIYRMAHEFYTLKLPLIPRLMTEYAHQLTGIDIHPGAEIGEHFFIDHGTGVVIGETTRIHDYVKLYQGVTLGALVVDKALRKTKRHPTILSHVTIYANATVLGGETVIGSHSIIGGNAWITSSIPDNSRVIHQSSTQVTIKSTQ